MLEAYKCTIYRRNEPSEILKTLRQATAIDTVSVSADGTDDARAKARAKLVSLGYVVHAMNFTPPDHAP